jgi:hypothetical protein
MRALLAYSQDADAAPATTGTAEHDGCETRCDRPQRRPEQGAQATGYGPGLRLVEDRDRVHGDREAGHRDGSVAHDEHRQCALVGPSLVLGDRFWTDVATLRTRYEALRAAEQEAGIAGPPPVRVLRLAPEAALISDDECERGCFADTVARGTRHGW